MIRSAALVLALALSACAGSTPPAGCRGEMFSLNGTLPALPPQAAQPPVVLR